MSFAENLRNELIYSDIKIKELAHATNIPYTTLLSYLNEKGCLPNVDAGVRIARALNVSVEYLVTGKDDVYTSHIKSLYDIFDRIAEQLQELRVGIPKHK